jgi:hypothetical protein
MTFIPLDRQFIPWSEKDGDKIDAQQFAARSWGTKSWCDVLSSHRVVLLSEAGSGKSNELAEQARQARAKGKRAFLFSVQNVGRDGLPAVLGAADRAPAGQACSLASRQARACTQPDRQHKDATEPPEPAGRWVVSRV